MFEHHYQRSRYELKYLIDEPCARQVRDFVRSHLQRDPHARADMRYSYPIYSLYLDCPNLSMFRATTQGQKNRMKLRVRYYDYKPTSPLFLEIKRRVNEVILKQRAIIKRDALNSLLAGFCPQPEDLCDPTDTDSYGVLREFCNLRNALHAIPRMHIYYEREAWISPQDENVRITFDRAAASSHYEHSLEPRRWHDAQIGSVILELKFDDRFPIWMRNLVRCCDLYRTTMGKYVHCMAQSVPASKPFAFSH